MDKRRWKRIIVKNRFPIEVMHGYESYSAQSQYNLLACWLMCVAYLYAVILLKNFRLRPISVDMFWL